MRRLFALAAIATLSWGTSGTFAADLPMKAPAVAAPPAWSWAGFYIGAHVGAGWGTVESELQGFNVNRNDFPAAVLFLPNGGLSASGLSIPISSHTVNGFLGGGQIGYNWQSGVVVFGVEADASWTNIEGKTPCVVLLTCKTDIDWIVTLAGRLGFTADKALIYAKGGVAWAESNYSAALDLGIGPSIGISSSDTRFGVLLGAGVEYAFLPNWSAKIEYNYIDFDDETVSFPFAVGPYNGSLDANITQKLHLVKFGLNYRFGGFGGRY